MVSAALGVGLVISQLPSSAPYLACPSQPPSAVKSGSYCPGRCPPSPPQLGAEWFGGSRSILLTAFSFIIAAVRDRKGEMMRVKRTVCSPGNRGRKTEPQEGKTRGGASLSVGCLQHSQSVTLWTAQGKILFSAFPRIVKVQILIQQVCCGVQALAFPGDVDAYRSGGDCIMGARP